MESNLNIKFLIIVIILFSSIIFVAFYFDNPFESPESIEFYLTSEQFKFTPEEITVEQGTDLRLVITSLDVTHGFELPEFQIFNIQVVPGHNTTVEFNVNQSGQFRFYCTVFCGAGHSDHLGSLIVT